MWRVAPLVLAVLLLAPPAFAAPRHGRSARKSKVVKSSSRKRTEIKLKDAPPVPDDQGAQASSSPPPTRGPTRIDFDDRLVQGQTNKSGAVYLYERKELKQRSMVKTRESFREEIIDAVYDAE